jgi:hypothetical protein
MLNQSSVLRNYFHVSQWLRRGFVLVNLFNGSPLVVTKISSYTLKITITIAHVTSHTEPSNYSSGLTALPLELRKSSEFEPHSRIFSYPLGTDHAQKTHYYCCVAQTTQKATHVITISPVHWRADCWLATSSKYSSYYWATKSEVFIAPLLGNGLIRHIICAMLNNAT